MKIRTDTRTGIKFIDYRIGGKRKRVSLGTKNNQIALIKAAQIADNKKMRDAGKTSFEAFWDRYLQHCKATLRKDTAINMDQLRKKIVLFGAPQYINDIDANYVDKFKSWMLQKGYEKSTVNEFLSRIKTMVSYANSWEITDINLKKVKKVKTEVERVEYHTAEELRDILAVAPSLEWRVIVYLGARAGLRKGEFLRLKWADVDFDKKELYVCGISKSHKFRIIPLVDKKLLDLLAKLKKSQNAKSTEYVFPGKRSPAGLSQRYKNWASRSGHNCFLHKLRHTFASHLAQQDVPLEKIAKLMGHASIQMTMKYVHLMPSHLADNVAKLEEL